MLDDEAQGEGSDHHRRGIGVAETAEDEDLRDDREARTDRQDERDEDEGRQIAGEDDGCRIDRRPEHGEDAEGDVIAMGEIDEAHDPEDERDAERTQGIEAAEA